MTFEDWLLMCPCKILSLRKDGFKRCGGDDTQTEYDAMFEIPVGVENSEKYVNAWQIILKESD